MHEDKDLSSLKLIHNPVAHLLRYGNLAIFVTNQFHYTIWGIVYVPKCVRVAIVIYRRCSGPGYHDATLLNTASLSCLVHYRSTALSSVHNHI